MNAREIRTKLHTKRPIPENPHKALQQPRHPGNPKQSLTRFRFACWLLRQPVQRHPADPDNILARNISFLNIFRALHDYLEM